MTLRFRVLEKHFHNGAIVIKCSAYVRELHGGKFRHEAILMAYDARKRKMALDYDNYVPNIGREPNRMRKSKSDLHGDLRYSDNLSMFLNHKIIAFFYSMYQKLNCSSFRI